MSEIVAGTLMKMVWVWSGGTANLDADYRTFKLTQSIDVVDGTAGADTNKVKYLGMKDATIEVNLVIQAGGTALNAALATGNIGTLTVQPEGTASNKPKITMPAFCNIASMDFPFNDVGVMAVTFNANAAMTIGSN